MRLLLLRHAATAWTATGQHTGRTDLELTPEGETEARATAELWSRVVGDRSASVVYSSPRRRALRTAELVMGAGVKPVVSEHIAEVDYGDYEGLTPAEIRQRDPAWTVWSKPCPGGESIDDAGARADRFILLLHERDPRETIAVVSHGHMLRVLAARLLGLPPSQGGLFGTSTCSIAELEQKDGKFLVQRWNLRSA